MWVTRSRECSDDDSVCELVASDQMAALLVVDRSTQSEANSGAHVVNDGGSGGGSDERRQRRIIEDDEWRKLSRALNSSSERAHRRC